MYTLCSGFVTFTLTLVGVSPILRPCCCLPQTSAAPRSRSAAGKLASARVSVSEALLERPPHDELRHLDRGLCAELVDARLRVLARREALARRILGSVAGIFLQ